MKYLISDLRNGKSKPVGFMPANSIDDAAEKLGLRSSAATPNGFVLRTSKGILIDIRLDEMNGPEIFGPVGLEMAMDKP
jgi:hypothetical protein